jgi:putative transcriptional regulator
MKNAVLDLRRQDNLTQQDLADRVGVSRQTILSIERGRFDPSLPLAFRIAREFGRPIEAVFFPAD